MSSTYQQDSQPQIVEAALEQGSDFAQGSISHMQDGGWEFETEGRRVRIMPIDREWDAGFTVHVLTTNCVALAGATVNANTTGALCVAVADALFAEVA